MGEKKGNVEQELAQNGTASIPLLKLQAIRLVRHRAKIKATRRNVRLGRVPLGQW